MNNKQEIAVVDLGGKDSQLIARHIRDMKVFSEMFPYTVSAAALAAKKPVGIVLTDTADDAVATFDNGILELGIPVYRYDGKLDGLKEFLFDDCCAKAD